MKEKKKHLFFGAIASFLIAGAWIINSSVSAMGVAPGGVTQGLQLWLKAESISCAGVCSPGSWTDQSPNGFIGTADQDENPSFYPSSSDASYYPSVVVGTNGDREGMTFNLTGLDESAFTRFIAMRYQSRPQYAHGFESFAGNPTSFPRNDTESFYATRPDVRPDPQINQYWLPLIHTFGDDGTVGWQRTLGNPIASDFTGGTKTSINGQFQFMEGANHTMPDSSFHEYILYDETVPAADIQKIESYLALKYGVELDEAGVVQLVNSAGATVWDNAANTGYNQSVHGLIQDDASGLDKKISRPTTLSDMITLATDNSWSSSGGGNLDPARTSIGEGNAVIVGGNNATPTAWTETGAPDNYMRTEVEWKAQKTGTPDGINILLNTVQWSRNIPSFNGLLYLAHGSDLENPDQIIPMTQSGSSWIAEDVDFTDGDNFTILTAQAPLFDLAYTVTNLYENASDASFAEIRVDGIVEQDIVFDVVDTGNGTINGNANVTAPVETTVTVPAGTYDGTSATAVSFPAPVLVDDGLIEANDTIELALQTTELLLFGDLDGDSFGRTFLTLTVISDDVAGISANTSSSTVDEQGGVVSEISITLDAEPTADVTISASSTESDEGSVSPSTLTLNSSNWNLPTNIFTVTGVNDLEIDGDITFEITFSPTSSTDSNFDGLILADVEITNLDDDPEPTPTPSPTPTPEPTPTPTVTLIPSSDLDGDGIPDSEEALANQGDGNGDGIQDAAQSFVASTLGVIDNQITTLEASTNCGTITNYETITESSLQDQDAAYQYPLGLINFSVDCAQPGSTVTVQHYYPGSYDTAAWEYRKQSPNGTFQTITDQVTFSEQIVHGQPVTVVTYDVIDGGPLDADGLVNGSITDPAGPSILDEDAQLSATGFNHTIVLQLVAFTLFMSALAVSKRVAKVFTASHIDS